ncbi:MAG: N-acetylmuramoyl-L-alanine amidase [Elusimicrobia bacterium]|nr:N-acetylmuramoyl-L-alanine amidase [Candidatus Liberimonas magnetica]
MKKIVPCIKILFIVFCLNSSGNTDIFAGQKVKAEKIQAIYEGSVINSKISVYKYGGDDYFSIKDLARIYGARLDWHQITGKVSLLMNNRKTDFYIKSTKVVIDGRKKNLKLPNHLISGNLYIPAEFILSEDFSSFSDTDSNYNPKTNILTVEKKLNLYPPRFYTDENATRIEIEMTDKLPYQINEKNKGRIEIIFQRAKIEKDKIKVNDGVIDEIDVNEKGRQAFVTIYLTATAGSVSSSFVENPMRLVFEVRRSLLAKGLKEENNEIELTCSLPVTGLVLSSSETVHITSAAPVAVSGLEPKQKAEPKINIKKIVLVLDAGHGGEDPGAVGQNGTEEKNINLAIVKELKTLFERNDPGVYEIVTTRNDDTFIPLVERTNLANEKKADLFICVHCNASIKKETKGFEIYFLSEKASDKEAQATAVLENSVLKLEGKPNKKREKLQELLWSLAVNEFINESSELCCFVGQEVTKRTKIENRGVRQAEFFVLRGAQMPAVLIECAFLSNLQEEAYLRTKKFQQKIADAIYDGIKQYEKRKQLLSAKNSQ